MRIAVYVDKENALREGTDTYGWQVVEIPAQDLTPAQRDMLVKHHGTAGYTSREETKLLRPDFIFPRAYDAAVVTPAQVCATLDRAIAAENEKREVEAREVEARIVEWCAQPVDERLYHGSQAGPYARWFVRGYAIPSGTRDDPRVLAAVGEAEAEAARLNTLLEAQEAEERARRDAEAKAEEEERKRRALRLQKQIEDWITLSGDEELIARHRDGSLPEYEVTDSIVSAHTLYALEEVKLRCGAEEYQRLQASDIDHEADCYEPSVTFDVENLDVYPASAWRVRSAVLRTLAEYVRVPDRIRACLEAHPVRDVEVVVREHTAHCPPCGKVSRLGVLAKWTVGEIKIRVEFSVPETEA